MKVNAKTFSGLYLFAGGMEIIGEAVNQPVIIYITKPLLMPLLILYFFASARQWFYQVHALICGGFFFSWVGDILLMLPGGNPSFFLGGLGSFLLAHLLYITAFYKSGGSFLKRKPVMILPFILLFLALMWLLYPGLGEMKIPVMVYAAVITLMVLFALNRYDRADRLSFWYTFIGGLLFLFSDSVIAVDRFIHPFEESRIVIMTSYIAGQFLIAEGMILQRKSFQNIPVD